MSKPNISIPARFAINGTKTDFSQTKITDGFDSVAPDILAGDNLNKLIDDTYQGLNGVLELYDTKVNKTGDTMTGGLRIDTAVSDDGIILRNTSDNTSSAPATVQIRSFRVFNNDDTILGDVRFLHNTNGSTSTQLYSRNYATGSTKQAVLSVDVSASGVASCTFPNTTCCDGQWVTQSVQIASDVSLAVGTTQLIEYDISNYLPNDGNSYEVRLSIDAQTGSGSGAGLTITIKTKDYNGNNTWTRICDMVARGSWTLKMGNNAIVPVGTNRKIVVDYTVGSKTATLMGLMIEAYRRIGTNA